MAIPLKTSVFWAIYRVTERRPVMQLPADKVRAASELRKKSLRLPGMWLITGKSDRGVDISESAAKLEDGTVLPLRVYRPKNTGSEPLPVVVNFHGGGWVSGDVHQSEWWASSVAAQSGAVVVSVEYRLAPEFKFPIPAEDCYGATAWIAEHADELGIDPSRIAVMGDSAGGNLAAVVSLMARDRNGPPIALQVLLYPSVELAGEFPSELENANAPVLGRADLDNVPRLYLADFENDSADPYASPLRAKHHGLPPALIQTAQYDPLRDQGAAYAAALRDAGVTVRLTNYVGAVHGYISLPGVIPAAHQALSEAVDSIRDAFAG
jgi:acetyl esterase